MKTDRTALLWGTVIGVTLVVATCALAFEFPHFQMPFTSTEWDTFLVSCFLFGLLIAAYRKLWKTLGFWALLVAFLGAHISLYSLLMEKAAETSNGLRRYVLYGAVSEVEFFIFAVIIARLCHRGPDSRSFT